MTMEDNLAALENRARQIEELAALAALDALHTATLELLEHERREQLMRVLELGVSQMEAANTVGKWPTSIRRMIDGSPDVDHAYEHARLTGTRVETTLRRVDALAGELVSFTRGDIKEARRGRE